MKTHILFSNKMLRVLIFIILSLQLSIEGSGQNNNKEPTRIENSLKDKIKTWEKLPEQEREVVIEVLRKEFNFPETYREEFRKSLRNNDINLQKELLTRIFINTENDKNPTRLLLPPENSPVNLQNKANFREKLRTNGENPINNEPNPLPKQPSENKNIDPFSAELNRWLNENPKNKKEYDEIITRISTETSAISLGNTYVINILEKGDLTIFTVHMPKSKIYEGAITNNSESKKAMYEKIKSSVGNTGDVLVIGEDNRTEIEELLGERNIYYCQNNYLPRTLNNVKRLQEAEITIESIKIVSFLPINKRQAKEMDIDINAIGTFVNTHKLLQENVFSRLNEDQILTSDYNKDRGAFASIFKTSNPAKAKENFLSKLRNVTSENIVFVMAAHASNNGNKIIISRDVSLTSEDIDNLPDGACKNCTIILQCCDAGLSPIVDSFRAKGAIVISFDEKVPIQIIGPSIENAIISLKKLKSMKIIDFLDIFKKACNRPKPCFRAYIDVPIQLSKTRFVT